MTNQKVIAALIIFITYVLRAICAALIYNYVVADKFNLPTMGYIDMFAFIELVSLVLPTTLFKNKAAQ